MPGTNAGTGQPVAFRCAVDRHEQGLPPVRHHVSVTGRERPYRGKGQGGIRTDSVSREYVCTCGHRGWSAHVDLAKDWYPQVASHESQA